MCDLIFFQVNGTHAIYENSIQGKVDSADGLIISRERTLNLQFACEYPLTQNASMDVAVDVLKRLHSSSWHFMNDKMHFDETEC